MVVPARYKPARQVTRWKHRILCGKTDARGCHSCGGELGYLIVMREMAIKHGYLYLQPVVKPEMARDPVSGIYRLARQRRPLVSGLEHPHQIGGGLIQAANAHLMRDTEGKPLKQLEPIYDAGGHDRIVIACPRCHTPNEVTHSDFAGYLERGCLPLH